MIECKNISYEYNPDNPFSRLALDQINLTIREGEFIAIIGHTGSGKSTLVQHLNGLMEPTKGDCIVDGINTKETGKRKVEIRKKVGLVFQYPEYQLFEETVFKDIAFGPKNMGVAEEDLEERVRRACEFTGLNYEEVKDKSPFELSGGQKRRVAIAGVVAMEPDVLILDEPTAGLDPMGRDEILEEIRNLYEKRKMTIVLVSHSMEDVARLCQRLIVIDKGKIIMDDTPKKVFSRREELEQIGLSIPMITKFFVEYQKRGHEVPSDILTVEEGYEWIRKYLKGESPC
ncbi:MAG: energy-coupling factor transporter ATPase [Tissierellia bacterium]|nr:energy-coupling factor transporter ATPase [Tissierellia bacterium]